MPTPASFCRWLEVLLIARLQFNEVFLEQLHTREIDEKAMSRASYPELVGKLNIRTDPER